ncbi:uncharacterized protein [Lolium perenne]|uniref:uncharacterized protein n=1 Tax=Lolium perenne TaxID=4522 RepID=UPI003A99CC69
MASSTSDIEAALRSGNTRNVFGRKKPRISDYGVSLHEIGAASGLATPIWSLIGASFITFCLLELGTSVLWGFTSSCYFHLLGLAKEKDLLGGKNAKGETVLHLAASQGCVGSCRFPVEELGFNVNCVSNTGVTPMLFAAFEGNVQVMRYLLDHGGDPAMPDEKGSTPLHLAAEEGHCEAVRLLLSKGVRVDPIDHRATPLHLAAAKDHDQVVKVLLGLGADPNRVVHHVFSPLMMAVRGKALKCMNLLIEVQ